MMPKPSCALRAIRVAQAGEGDCSEPSQWGKELDWSRCRGMGFSAVKAGLERKKPRRDAGRLRVKMVELLADSIGTTGEVEGGDDAGVTFTGGIE